MVSLCLPALRLMADQVVLLPLQWEPRHGGGDCGVWQSLACHRRHCKWLWTLLAEKAVQIVKPLSLVGVVIIPILFWPMLLMHLIVTGRRPRRWVVLADSKEQPCSSTLIQATDIVDSVSPSVNFVGERSASEMLDLLLDSFSKDKSFAYQYWLVLKRKGKCRCYLLRNMYHLS